LTSAEKKSKIKKALRGAFLRGLNKFSAQKNKADKRMSKITEYLKETKTELKHVIWPKRSQTILYTLIVVVLSVLIAYFLGIFDFIFSKGLGKII
jgi:preprotein translocase subunit SecE